MDNSNTPSVHSRGMSREVFEQCLRHILDSRLGDAASALENREVNLTRLLGAIVRQVDAYIDDDCQGR